MEALASLPGWSSPFSLERPSAPASFLAPPPAATLIGVMAGHASAGMSRGDLKELGEALDAGQAGLVVVAVADTQAKIKAAMKRAEKVHAKELKADHTAIQEEVKQAADAP